MADLLNQVDAQNQAKEGEMSSTSSLSGGEDLISGTEGSTSGDNLLSGASGSGTTSEDSGTTNTAGSNATDTKLDRTESSLYDEIRELRAENKARRLQLQEETSKITSKFEEKLLSYEDKMKTATAAKDELEALKAREADKKRSVEEKLINREAALAQVEAEKKVLSERLEQQLSEKEAELSELRTAQEAQKQVYQERINEEIAKIPETRRKFAEMMIKGHGDPREAWAALSEAKADGLFEDKVTVVSHATPGANVARMTQSRFEAAQHGESESLTATQKIAAGLKQATSRRGKLL